MIKMKSKRGAAKRFRRTASGSYKHRATNRGHILTKKSTKRKRHLRGMRLAKKCNVKAIRYMLTEQ